MKNKFILVLLVLSSSFCIAQEKITWQDLADVKFTDKYFPEFEEYFMYPNFGDEIKTFDGKKVQLKGYFLNISPEDGLYILSKAPMAMCFFCGMGGPETVVELQLKNNPKLKTDDIVSVTGTLKLNSEDVNHLIYILSDCTIEKVK
ncbi:hypothetical protein [Winogradskyella algicola]|uniref:hypothetical protein n=1 Tax=Winogradskyella algicola TaxID=2575815 RepID=UPI001108012E|nr:hypothetical protein [Winogradskyella algicola]